MMNSLEALDKLLVYASFNKDYYNIYCTQIK